MKILVHSDRTPSLESGPPTYFYAHNIVKPDRSIGPLNQTRVDDIKNILLDEDRSSSVHIIPPWDSANRRPFNAVMALCEWLDANGYQIHLILDDLHFLKWMSDGLSSKNLKRPVKVTSNFLEPQLLWNPQVPVEFEFSGDYPFHLQIEYAKRMGWFNNRPKYPLAYVGRYIPKRLTILKRMGFQPKELQLLGPSWHKQDIFPYAYSFDGGQPWLELVELYREAQWHLIVQDVTQNSVQPAVSRIGECLAAGRPLIFHESFLRGRELLSHKPIEKWCAANASDCRRILTLDPEEALVVQRAWAQSYYEAPERNHA